MKTLLFIFSHTPTKEQIFDAKEHLGVNRILNLPEELKIIWSNIPKDSLGIDKMFKDFILENCNRGDYIVIEGEFGMVYKLVSWSLNNGYIPIYSYCKREYKNEKLENGTVKNIHYFNHIGYKNYER